MKLRRIWFPLAVLTCLIGLAVAITVVGLHDSAAAKARHTAGQPAAHTAAAHGAQPSGAGRRNGPVIKVGGYAVRREDGVLGIWPR
jgi:hypothetical protein